MDATMTLISKHNSAQLKTSLVVIGNIHVLIPGITMELVLLTKLLEIAILPTCQDLLHFHYIVVVVVMDLIVNLNEV